jgi:hypothetical protein
MQADRGHPEEQEEKRATLRTVTVITGFYGMNLVNYPRLKPGLAAGPCGHRAAM